MRAPFKKIRLENRPGSPSGQTNFRLKLDLSRKVKQVPNQHPSSMQHSRKLTFLKASVIQKKNLEASKC